MRRAVRAILIVVVILVVALIALPFLIPVNQFRSTIEDRLSVALGRKVHVGNLSLSLLSGALSAEDLSIADDPKFSNSPFLKAESLKVGVEIVPLITSRSLRVRSLVIERPEVTLLHGAGDRWNFSSLGGSTSRAKSGSQSSSAAPDFQVASLQLKDGRITIGRAGSAKRTTYSNLNLLAEDISPTQPFRVSLSAGLPKGGSLQMKKAVVGPLDRADTSLTPFESDIMVKGFDLAASGILDPAAGLAGLMDLDAKVRSEKGNLSTKGAIKLSKLLLVAGGTPSSVPATVEFATKSNLRTGAGVLQPSTVKVGNATAHISGAYESRGESTEVNLKFKGEDMPARDLQALLGALAINLPKGSSLESGTLSADLHVGGPTNHLVTNGSMGLFKARLSGFNLGSKFAAISSLAGIKTGSDLDIEKLTTNIHMAPDGLRAEALELVAPSMGTLQGAGTVDAKNNLDFKMLATLAAPQPAAPSGGANSAPAPDAASGGLGGVLSGLLGKATGSSGPQRIPFLIQGTASDPKFIPDVNGIAREVFKSKLNALASGAKTAGPQAAPNQPANQPADPLKALGDLFKKKKP